MIPETYVTIGAILGSTSIILWLIMIGHLSYRTIIAYVKDKKTVLPQWCAKLPLIDSRDYDITDILIYIFPCFMFTLVVTPAWPFLILGSVGYLFLRVLRFTYRIKTSLCNITKSKKCLKEHEPIDIKL